MGTSNQRLSASLQTGYIDHSLPSHKEYLPQLLVNGDGNKVLTTIIKELNNCEEFWFSVAFVTTSGIATLIETLISLEERGVRGKILVSQYLNFTQPEALKRLLKFKNIELKIATDGDFHSKGYLFKKGDVYDLIIGSSNLTDTALCSNIEWNLKITATPVSYIIFNAINEFTLEYEKAVSVDAEFIRNYEVLYKRQIDYSILVKRELLISNQREIIPNTMQLEALRNIQNLRSAGKTKALLISATGTGKTFLSAFDTKKFNPKKFLFVVHRLNIAEAAMRAYQLIFGSDKKMGIYSGNRREIDADFIFTTIQTLSKKEHLSQFNPNHFDYITIDETHRAGADSYQNILNHFNSKFLLGMTATPERTDGFDIFKLFDYNIAYEIRLHKALEEKILSPFHYYGVSDVAVDDIKLADVKYFKLLVADERIDRIIEKANIYDCDSGKVRGLVFCSRKDECIELSKGFNKRGFRSIALTGDDHELERSLAIERLESDDEKIKLDYIFTVDIFNEGIDIPTVNQIILLRPTQSAIIFVQQLGRGLRKIDNKDYLTVIDFIGNYKNNFLVPVALYGDTSYNKDSLRKFMASGSNLIPGASTINFDRISKERIFAAIDTAKMELKKDLVNDYKLLKFRLGRIPMMVDFIEQGSRDPQLFVNYAKSYYNFAVDIEPELKGLLSARQMKLLELFSCEINNSKRVEESLILKALLENGSLELEQFKTDVKSKYGYVVSEKTIMSCNNNLNFKFVTDKENKKIISVNQKYNINVISRNGENLNWHQSFTENIQNETFTEFLKDNVQSSIKAFDTLFASKKFNDGFVLYRKYSRKDVFRILNWDGNPVAQNVGGYIISPDKSNCPIFVNYHKDEDISSTTKYEDGFINNSEFEWMSKSKRTLKSPDVQTILNYKTGLRLPLFIKKSNDEGTEFYYMGDVVPEENSFKQTTMPDDKGNKVSVVKIRFAMKHPVDDTIYDYITNSIESNVSNVPKIEVVEQEDHILPFRILPEAEVREFQNCVPLYDVKIAAGGFSDPHHNATCEWVQLPKPFMHSKDFFICRVTGESMNKIIPNGSWCLFKIDLGGTRNGKVVLVQHNKIQDRDYGSGYTIKRYQSTKEVSDKGWNHESITLSPQSNNPEFKDIIFSGDELSELKVIGVFERLLG